MSKSSRKPMSEYVLSLSYGKDSTACLGAIKELGWPLHRIITADVWATDTIPADPPPMVEFKAKLDAYILEEFGIQVEHLCAMRNGEKLTYEKLFYHIPKRKPGGKFSSNSPAGFPYQKGAWCNDRLKTNALDSISNMGGGTMDFNAMGKGAEQPVCSNGQPCGFPYTVGSWCKKLKDGTYPRLPDPQGQLVYQRPQTPGFPVAPLHKERRQILCSTLGLQRMSRNGLNGTLSPGTYSLLWRSDGTRRIAVSGAKKEVSCPLSTPLQRGGGCWFCHNQGVDQLRLLRKPYPEYWALLMKWDLDSPTTFKADGHTVHDYDLRFHAEDLGMVPTDRKFRWKMLTSKVQAACVVDDRKKTIFDILERSKHHE